MDEAEGAGGVGVGVEADGRRGEADVIRLDISLSSALAPLGGFRGVM